MIFDQTLDIEGEKFFLVATAINGETAITVSTLRCKIFDRAYSGRLSKNRICLIAAGAIGGGDHTRRAEVLARLGDGISEPDGGGEGPGLFAVQV